MSIQEKQLYVVRVYGNWCLGWRWEIIDRMTGRAIAGDGPYRESWGRRDAYTAAKTYAFEHCLPVDGGFNPNLP